MKRGGTRQSKGNVVGQRQYGSALRALAILCIILCSSTFAPSVARAAPYAALVMDARSGEVYHEHNADTRLHPASLTKMMTLYIAFEAVRLGEISLDSMVRISANAAREPPSKLGLREGQRVQLRYLIRAAAVKSANDAATAIGEAIEGSEAAFARRMTRTARAMGMTRTTFKNAHGLTEAGHLSTARDMAILGRQLFYDFPEYYHIFSRRSADAGVAEVANTNRRFLDGYPGADGIKTGYTNAAGFNLVASAERGQERIIASVFGGTSTVQRNAKMTELMNLGFQRAPARVAVNRPSRPRYDRVPEEGPVEVLVAEAGAPAPRGAAGKTIRVSGLVTRSPRPLPRGSSEEAPPPELVAAIESDVAGAMAALNEADAIAEALVAALAEAPADEAVAATTTEDATEIAPTEVATLAASIRPRARVMPAEPAAETPAAEDAGEEAPQLAEAAIEAIEVVEVAEATAEDAEAVPEETLQVATAEPMEREAPAEAGAALAAELADTLQFAEADALAAATNAAMAEALGILPEDDAVAVPPAVASVALAAVAPPPRPGRIVESFGAEVTVAAAGGEPDALPATAPAEAGGVDVASVVDDAEALAVYEVAVLAPEPVTDPVIRPEPEVSEIVERLSTSNSSQFGISLGSFRSRDAAERAMISAAIAEPSGLVGSVRRVAQRAGGFEATFLGMTEDQASYVCRRIGARGSTCETVHR